MGTHEMEIEPIVKEAPHQKGLAYTTTTIQYDKLRTRR